MVDSYKECNHSLVHYRKAFTMIELIFAIVVVGITLLTVPLMIQTNNKAIERSLVGEAIFLASSVVASESTLVWDNRSVVDTGNVDVYILSKILDTGTLAGVGTGGFNRTSLTSNLRVGGLDQSRHRQFFDYNDTAGAPDNGLTSPAQTGGVSVPLGLSIDNSAADIAGYKDDYDVNGTSRYVADSSGVLETTATGVSNLKMIEVRIPVEFDPDVNEYYDVVLRAYMANIGEVDYEKRSF